MIRSYWITVAAVAAVVLGVRFAAADAPAGRYAVLGDGVQDTQTGLVWQQPISAATYSFAEAASYCPTLGSGWRVPSANELPTLVDFSTTNPSIDSAQFAGTPPASFWTSSDVVGTTTLAFYVEFSEGQTFYADPASKYRVRCVR